MCIFTDAIESVSQTKIFGRVRGPEQMLVYEMSFSSNEPVAMVLPLPVSVGAGERAVRFINMELYPDFFPMLDILFPVTPRPEFLMVASASLDEPQPLVVHDVGVFEASFVPTLQDFKRLDPRFQLDESIWEQLPDYRDFGFAVFQLRAGAQRVHPLALAFPTRSPKSIFYPTVHVHDSAVHSEAHFDHTLYAQPDGDTSAPEWQRAAYLPDFLEWRNPSDEDIEDIDIDIELESAFELDGDSTPSESPLIESPLIEPPEVLDLSRPCYRRRIFGQSANEDVLF